MLAAEPFIKNYRWTPQRGLRFHVFDKDGGGLVASAEAPSAFCFHHVNAFEDGDDIKIDLVAYDDAGVIDQLYLRRLRAGEVVNATGRLSRYTLRPGSSQMQVEGLADTMIELPRIDYARCAGRPYRYVWGVGRREGAAFLDQIARIDTSNGSALTWWEDGCYPGEPVFVSAPDAQKEGVGVLLSVVLDARRSVSFLLVLDAQSLAEIARAECPHHIPFSFHGNYFPAR
jgi:carotenoid cleavage dioxygenase-like enzyme